MVFSSSDAVRTLMDTLTGVWWQPVVLVLLVICLETVTLPVSPVATSLVPRCDAGDAAAHGVACKKALGQRASL